MVTQQTFHWERGQSAAPLPPLADLQDRAETEPPMVALYHTYGPIFRIERAGQEAQTVLAGAEANVFMARHEDEFFTTREHWEQFDSAITQGKGNSMTEARDGTANRKRRAQSSRQWSRTRILDQIQEMVAIVHECIQHVTVSERI